MTKQELEQSIADFIDRGKGNYVGELRLFAAPLIGYAAADDPLFSAYKKPLAIGPHYRTPLEWLPEAKTVVSVFLPFTEKVRASNRKNDGEPSEEWLHGRIEGQAFQNEVCKYIVDLLETGAGKALSPMIDTRFSGDNPATDNPLDEAYYTSNWSERHAAYAAGLGTFGLSRGLITRAGIAGRYVSAITTSLFEPTPRAYTGLYDYCSHCGACVQRCPAKAISLEYGKKHVPCSAYVDKIRAKHSPYFGCGKCQTAVPCEARIPIHH